jgi:hypothetical protein
MRIGLRAATAAVCLAVATAVACAPLTSTATDSRAVGPAVALGLAGVAAVAVGLLGWASAVGAGAFLLGAGYGVSLVGHGDSVDSGVVFIAAALLLVTEMGYWSLDARVTGSAAAWPSRAAHVAAFTGAGALAAGAVQAAVALPPARGLALTAAGVLGAVGVLLIVDRLARRGPPGDTAESR